MMGVGNPALAQTDPVQIPCGLNEQAAIVDLWTTYENNIFRVFNSSGGTDETRVELIGRILVNMDEFMKDWAGTTFPDCADGVFSSDYINMLNLNYMNTLTLYGLAIYTANNTDVALGQDILEAMNDRESWLGRQDSVFGSGGQFESELLFPSGMPSCDETTFDRKLNRMVEQIEAYQAAVPEYEAFVTTGRADFDTLFSLETLATSTLINRIDICAEMWSFELDYVAFYNATSLAVFLPQFAAYERTYGSAAVANQLDAIAREYQTWIANVSPTYLGLE